MSQDSSRAAYERVDAEDVSDDALTAGEFRAFRTELRLWMEIVTNALARIERRQEATEDRIIDAESRIGRLEAPRRKARK